MGIYTDHWAQYRRRSVRGLVHAVLMFAALLPAIAGLAYWLDARTAWATPVQIGLLAAWLLGLLRLLVKQSRVDCPKCGTVYSRGKYLSNCPSCGLRMLQDDP